MKSLFCLMSVSLLFSLPAQAGLFDWLKRPRNTAPPAPVEQTFSATCEYTREELRFVIPREQEAAKQFTPRDYPVAPVSGEELIAAKPWLRGFRYVIVVNRAAQGLNAQSVTIFEDGYRIDRDVVSTGREKLELKRVADNCKRRPPNSYYSTTATGYYPVQQLIELHRSGSYDVDMPYAMFYDRQFGMALHEVPPAYVRNLGQRASGGCTRMRSETARNLFERIRRTEGSEIPMINKDGSPITDFRGNVKTTRTLKLFGGTIPAYSAVVIIQDTQF